MSMGLCQRTRVPVGWSSARAIRKTTKNGSTHTGVHRSFKAGDWKGALRHYHFAWLNVKGTAVGHTRWRTCCSGRVSHCACVPGLGESASTFMPIAGMAGGDGGNAAGGATLSKGEKDECKALTESLHLNLAACYLHTEQYSKCIAACNVAIGVNAGSAKVGLRCKRRCRATPCFLPVAYACACVCCLGIFPPWPGLFEDARH